MTTEPRPDLVDALIQSCWLVESARARILRRWGGEFASQGERAHERSTRVRAVLDEREVHVPEPVLTDHTNWMSSLVGATPTDVPLGAAVLQRLGHWTDVYMTPYLGEEAEAFGEDSELRFPVEPRDLRNDEAYVKDVDLPDGDRFVVFTDIHVGAAGIPGLVERAVADINAVKPEFVLVPGDITDDGEPEQFELARKLLDPLDAPVHAVLGNHDTVQRSTSEAAGHQLFAQAFGEKPTDTVVTCGPLQIALLDSTDPTPSPFPDWDLARGGFRDDAGGVNNGAFHPGQIESLAAHLDPDRPTLLVLHHELQPFEGFPPVMFGVRTPDSNHLFETLADHRIVGVLAGHTHRSALTEVGPGVPQLEVPALKDWPYTYTVVTCTDEGVHVAVRQISDADLVWERAQKVPPIYTGYVLGPLAAREHTFAL